MGAPPCGFVLEFTGLPAKHLNVSVSCGWSGCSHCLVLPHSPTEIEKVFYHLFGRISFFYVLALAVSPTTSHCNQVISPAESLMMVNLWQSTRKMSCFAFCGYVPFIAKSDGLSYPSSPLGCFILTKPSYFSVITPVEFSKSIISQYTIDITHYTKPSSRKSSPVSSSPCLIVIHLNIVL